MDGQQPQVPLPEQYWKGNDNEQDGPAPYRRAGGTKKDLLAKYRQRLDTAQRWRKDEQYEDTWRRLSDLYRNRHFDQFSSEAQIAVNVAFATVNTIVPSVSVNHPRVTVTARQPEMEPAAEAAEAAVNYWWRHYNWRVELKRAVKDSLIFGNGWVKVGWKYEAEYREKSADEQFAEFQQLRDQADLQLEQDPMLDGPSDEMLRSQVDERAEEPKVDCPFVERVSPFDLFVDPESTCFEDLKWVAQRMVLPLEDVKKDRRYRKAARDRLQADASTNVRWRDSIDSHDEAHKYDDDVKRVVLWEFYDLRAEFYCVFAGSGDDFLLEPTDFPYPYGSPYVFLGNYEVPDQFYNIGDLEVIEPLQHELNATRSDMVNHRKRWQRAYIARRDALDPSAQNALLTDKDNRIIYVDGDVDLHNVVVPLQQLSLDPQMYQHSQQIEQDVDLVSGVSEYQRGGLSEVRRTATEAAMIQDAANARAADKLAKIETFMSDVARRVVELAQQYLTGDHVARIVGMDGAASWIEFDIERIQGEFDFEVEAGSTQPRDEAYRRQQALQLANVLSPYVGVAVNPQALVTYVLREGFGVKNPEQFITMPSPMMDPSMMGGDPSMMGGAQAGGGFPPSAGPQGLPAGQGPTDMPQETAATPNAGVNIPPEILLQLQNQLGLELPNGG